MMDISDSEVKELQEIDAALLSYTDPQLDPLDEVEDQLHAEKLFRKKWRKRPGDLDKLVHSKSSQVVICVAKVGRSEDTWKLLSDSDPRVRLVAGEEYEAAREEKQRREGLL